MTQFRRLVRLFAAPFKYRYSFRFPSQSKVVIYPDGKSAEVLLNYVDREETQVLSPFGSSLNVPVLLRMLLAGKWSRFFYLLNYLKFVKPALVITTVDNDVNFYQIKSYLPQTTTIAVQNGIRGNLSNQPNGSFFELLKVESLAHNLSADFVCTFGSAVQDLYRQHISTDLIACGSLRNNFFTNSDITETPNRLVYVSGLSDYPTDPDRIFLYYKNIGISFREFYEAELLLCELLADYCDDHYLEFAICGKQSTSSSAEAEFFKRTLGHRVPYISTRDNPFDSYQFLSTARYVVSLDSTIAYEFLSRNKRTAFFSARFNQIQTISLGELAGFQFGYPQAVPPFGPFWSSVLSKVEIDRVMKNLVDFSDDEWLQAIKPFKATLMIYDPGNSILKRLIDSQMESPVS